jgi:preprotein translocase subunit SecD
VQRHLLSLTITLGLVGAALLGVVATDTTPQLGLDLQGGVSVVLAPQGRAPSDAINKAKDIIERRVNGLGVAEPQISRQGRNVVVDLPGVKNTDRARSLVGKTAKLTFRPVLGNLPPYDPTAASELSSTSTTAPAAPTTSGTGTTTTTAKPKKNPGAAIPSSTTDDPGQVVIFPDKENRVRYQLAPAPVQGSALKSAKARFENQWLVNFTLNGKGAKVFDDMAAQNVGKQVAIVLDGQVQSAPTIQTASFRGRGQITGNFNEKEAKNLALVLRYGALPVEFKELTVQSVSPTLGRDQLRSGVVAGLIGLAIVALYMLVYYRLLGMVVWAGLLLSAAMLYTLTAWLGSAIGLTLTLSGVTGVIVSVGVTVDSYVVYFERLKDEVRSGKTIRSSLDRGFQRSFRTIIAADLVSLIAAFLLWIVTVGSVKGFAFFLGLSTLLDVFVAYFFMHPLVSILGRRPAFTNAGWLGIARGLDVEGATA